MAVTTRTGIPFLVLAASALAIVVAQGSVATVRHEVELRVLLVLQPSGPEITPLPKDFVDCRLDRVTVNTVRKVRNLYPNP